MTTMTGHLRKGQDRPVLTGRAGRRHEARAQARATARKYSTRVIDHHERAVIANANAGHILVRDFLQNIGFADWERYESAAGRKIAEVYRENHGTNPDQGGKVVLRGRIWSTMRYSNVLDLVVGAHAYKRTAHLVAVPAAAEANVEAIPAADKLGLLNQWRNADANLRGHQHEHPVCAFVGQRWGCPQWRALNAAMDKIEAQMMDAGMPSPNAEIYAGDAGAAEYYADLT